MMLLFYNVKMFCTDHLFLESMLQLSVGQSLSFRKANVSFPLGKCSLLPGQTSTPRRANLSSPPGITFLAVGRNLLKAI